MSALAEAAGEPIETYTERDILEAVRELAARRDPRRCGAYAGVTPARIKYGARSAQQLLALHLDYRRQSRHGRGRRAHSAAVYDHLAQTNDASLVLALAVLDLAFAVLPPGTKDD